MGIDVQHLAGTAPAQALPSIYVPPWAGGEPNRVSPLGVVRTRMPPMDLPHRALAPYSLAPRGASCITANCQDERLWYGHLHQLFRHLRFTNDRARITGRARDLGHFNSLLRNRDIEVREHGRAGTRGTTSPNCSTMRRRTRSLRPLLNMCQRPGGKHITIVVHTEAHRACPGECSGPWRCSSRSPLPWPRSVPLGRRGVESRPGAWRRLAVRDEGTGVTVALSASWRSLRLRHHVPTTSISTERQLHNKGFANMFEPGGCGGCGGGGGGCGADVVLV